MTYKLYLPSFSFFYSFNFFPLWRLFFFLPATERSDIEPLPVGALSRLTPLHIFAVPLSSSPSSPPDDELLTEYIIRAVVLFVVVLASKKRDELLMTTDKNERGEYEKKKKKLKIYFEGSCRVLRLHQEA